MGGDDFFAPVPGADFDPDSAIMQARALQALQDQMRWVVELLGPLDREILIDATGQKFEALVDLLGTAPGFGSPWELTVESSTSSSARVKVKCGTILRSVDDLTHVIKIDNADRVYSVSAGNKIWLKMTGDYERPIISLESGSRWTKFPSGYEITTTPYPKFKSYFYPLWAFTSEESVGAASIAKNLYAIRLAPRSDLLRSISTHHQGGESPLAVPFFVSYHQALPK